MKSATRWLSIAALSVFAVVTASTDVLAEAPRPVPMPATDLPPGNTTSGVVVLAGGCFWGVQGVYQHVEGVTSAVSGYAGGEKSTAEYERVSTGLTGHAESVQVTYDPRRISFGRLLQIFFSVVHDPTEVNRQGPDVGTQYRSAIFASNADQARVAQAYVAQLDQTHTFKKSLATKIETDRAFFPAEPYHQDYLTRHPTYPYIAYNDLPKVAALERLFPELYRPAPVLVSPARSTTR
jgi:peptide-methionine (S)-S-oxide reductase